MNYQKTAKEIVLNYTNKHIDKSVFWHSLLYVY